MSDRPFVETWRAIAAHCGRSERWARYQSERAQRPLPAFKVGGIVRMYLDDFEDWVSAEMAADAAEKLAARERLRAAARAGA